LRRKKGGNRARFRGEGKRKGPKTPRFAERKPPAPRVERPPPGKNFPWGKGEKKGREPVQPPWEKPGPNPERGVYSNPYFKKAVRNRKRGEANKPEGDAPARRDLRENLPARGGGLGGESKKKHKTNLS